MHRAPGTRRRRLEIDSFASITGLTQLTGASVTGGNADEFWIAADGVDSTFTDVSQRFDTFSNDVLVGGSGNDTITAGVGADLIYGGAGNDVIDAGTGADVISGGRGNDSIQGGAGDDVFAYNRGDGSDTVHDNGVVIARETLTLVHVEGGFNPFTGQYVVDHDELQPRPYILPSRSAP